MVIFISRYFISVSNSIQSLLATCILAGSMFVPSSTFEFSLQLQALASGFTKLQRSHSAVSGPALVPPGALLGAALVGEAVALMKYK